MAIDERRGRSAPDICISAQEVVDPERRAASVEPDAVGGRVNTVVVVVAQYLLFALALLAGLVWLVLDRGGKVRLAASAVLGLAFVGAGIWIAGRLHVDPRPFVQDRSIHPLFPHPADNGFPSDHAAAGGLLTALVLRYRRRLGVLVGAGAALVAAARVDAHVHHVQDVVAGLLIGLAAGAVGVLVVEFIASRLEARSREAHPSPVTEPGA